MTTASRAEAFLLREYEARDLEGLCALDRQCFPEKIAYPLATMRATIEREGAFTLVAEEQSGRVAAFVVAGRGSPRIGYVATLDVDPGFRRQGLATRLMQSVEKRLAELDVRKIRLETATANPARRLFEKLGFARVGKIERYYEDDSDAWVLEKPIARKARQRSAG
jgi:ribosomal protein S18 acetylase RimI-like enzyme